ncbi:MAG: hypothetical protein NPINA01_09590 [Nitrospinaceae bacterium]|nr:MAG: hypothetical protein NPINA01_09590 [Nitrospinaceae bacterium]
MKMLANLKFAVFTVASMFTFSLFETGQALAVVQYEQYITPGVILGLDSTNGGFTTDRRNGVEIGLRTKLRFNSDNLAENTFNSNSNGTYNFTTGRAPSGFPFDPAPNNTPVWNFEWSINTNYDESSGLSLNDLTYEMGLDFDPGPRTKFLVFDPITLDLHPPLTPPDHAFGDNYTPNGEAARAEDNPAYTNLLTSKNVAQNSWNYEFFDGPPFDGFDPAVNGNYSIYFLARNAEEQVVARADIQVLVGDAEPVVPADSFQCYDVTVSSNLDSYPEAGLSDQFGLREKVHLGNKIESYCTPTDKDGGGVINPDNTLSCYSVKETRLRQEVTVNNQFGEHTILLTKPELLCIPSMQSRSINLEGGDDGDDHY